MAYTAPRTWVAAETVTAALMNTHVRDNILAVVADMSGITNSWIKTAMKSSDQTWTTDTTLADVTDLSFAIGASESWLFFVAAHLNATATADWKFHITFPAGATGNIGVAHSYATYGSAAIASNVFTSGDSSFAKSEFIHAGIVNSTTAGTVQLQAAQNVSDGTSTFYAKSWLVAIRT